MAYQTVPPSPAVAAALAAKFLTATASSDLSAEVNLGALTTGIIKHTVSGGVSTPATADPALDYVGPQKTANTASATTVTLPETGLVVPITGTTQIDYLTKPTGDAPRLVILWIQSGLTVRHEVAGAGAGAAFISMVPTGGTANLGVVFAANSVLLLMFDGTAWRRVGSAAHWDGNGITGLTGQSNARLILDAATGTKIQWGAGHFILFDGSRITVSSTAMTRLTSRVRFDQGTVASATQVTFPQNCSSVLVTGTTTMNTFVATGWEEGSILWLEFDNILTITNNSGGTNDFLSRDGVLNITTAAGMVLPFRFDGTDFKEIGR